MKNQKSNRKISIIILVIIIIFVALGLTFWLNRVLIFDTFAAWSFHPSAEIAAIEDKIGLTSRGETIFEATAPSLESRESFNEHCKSHDQEISVLGCYNGKNIYIYNVESEDLNGVKESTAAHELLHAVWERLSNSEKSRLSNLLLSVYDDEKYHTLLAEDLETYSDEERIDELHSRIGTEIANLPDELEQHYASYFLNQDLVVDYYDNYIEPFRDLSDEIDRLTSELEELDAVIEEKTNKYYQEAENLSQRIDEFNACASTAGCFLTDGIFNSSRSLLINAQAALDDSFDEINDLITEYNNLVAEYNDNVIRGETLEKAMNSNSELKTTIK